MMNIVTDVDYRDILMLMQWELTVDFLGYKAKSRCILDMS